MDQQDVNGATPLSVNELASMIHQNVYLFDKTIEDNVLLNHHFSDAQINQALTQSGVAKFMSQLTDGLNTSVGENGKKIYRVDKNNGWRLHAPLFNRCQF